MPCPRALLPLPVESNRGPHKQNCSTKLFHKTSSWLCVCPSFRNRNLGVFFECMKMDKHICIQATYYQLRNISAIRSLLTRSAAESLIHSLVTSRIDFCNSLLVGLPSAMLNRLQGVQNAAARLLTGTKHMTTSPLFSRSCIGYQLSTG